MLYYLSLPPDKVILSVGASTRRNALWCAEAFITRSITRPIVLEDLGLICSCGVPAGYATCQLAGVPHLSVMPLDFGPSFPRASEEGGG